jgi:hypothetical protein
MWVLSGEVLEQRLALDPRIGGWLDYWLQIHVADAYPIWTARPFGVTAVVKSALAAREPFDGALREQLKRELLRVVNVCTFASSLPRPPVASLSVDRQMFSVEWLEWLDRMDGEVNTVSVVSSMVKSIAACLKGHDFVTAFFLTRQLASELGGSGWPSSQLADLVKGHLCSGQWAFAEFDERLFSDELRNLLTGGSSRQYDVFVPIAPLAISSLVADRLNRREMLVVENKDGRRLVSGLRITVNAVAPAQAVSLASSQCSRILETLRLRYYLLPAIGTVARVRDLQDETEYHVDLPQPFWRKDGRREVPRFFGDFQRLVKTLHHDEALRWRASRWHLGQAFAGWPEDVQGASAKVWQALESFGKNGASSSAHVKTLGHNYIEIVMPSMLEFVATKLSQQAAALHDLFGKKRNHPDWFFWDKNRMDATTWASKVIGPRAPWTHSRWKNPTAPVILFHPQIGLLTALWKRMASKSPERWMERRSDDDLDLLRGSRNKIVHSGQKALPDRAAGYLASYGAEVLLTTMNASAKRVTGSHG